MSPPWLPRGIGSARLASMSAKMTREEREAFLADLHVGVLGVNHGDTERPIIGV